MWCKDRGKGEDVDVGDVFTEMDVSTGGGVDTRDCWLARRDLCLAWDCASTFGAGRSSSTTICTSLSESSCPRSSERSPPRATGCCFRSELISTYRCCRFLFLRGDTRGNNVE